MNILTDLDEKQLRFSGERRAFGAAEGLPQEVRRVLVVSGVQDTLVPVGHYHDHQTVGLGVVCVRSIVEDLANLAVLQVVVHLDLELELFQHVRDVCAIFVGAVARAVVVEGKVVENERQSSFVVAHVVIVRVLVDYRHLVIPQIRDRRSVGARR